MEKAFVAQRVAKKLFVTEAAVDGALAEAAELMSEMLKARKDVNTSLVFADDAQVKMMEAIKALSEARTAMVGVHNELNEAKLRLGIRTKMGGENKPPRAADDRRRTTVAARSRLSPTLHCNSLTGAAPLMSIRGAYHAELHRSLIDLLSPARALPVRPVEGRSGRAAGRARDPGATCSSRSSRDLPVPERQTDRQPGHRRR